MDKRRSLRSSGSCRPIRLTVHQSHRSLTRQCGLIRSYGSGLRFYLPIFRKIYVSLLATNDDSSKTGAKLSARSGCKCEHLIGCPSSSLPDSHNAFDIEQLKHRFNMAQKARAEWPCATDFDLNCTLLLRTWSLSDSREDLPRKAVGGNLRDQ